MAVYDQAYYDHWYRDQGFGERDRLARKVHYAVGAVEYLFERPVRTVLDVGCGEGPWSVALAELRPEATYVGVDPSEYAVARYGEERNLRLGGLGDLDTLQLDIHGGYDLIVCSDVIAYVDAAPLRRGLQAISSMLDGVALLEVFTSVDDFEGDRVNYHHRPPATYRRWFAEAGLQRIGPQLYANDRLLPTLAAFERDH